jgi:hypothetical protein
LHGLVQGVQGRLETAERGVDLGGLGEERRGVLF